MASKTLVYESQSQVIKALAHPARLMLVHLLSKHAVCVCELTEAVGCDISTVSLHLAVLKRVGIVVSEKRANKVFYSLKCPCVMDFLGCIANVVRTNARQQSKAALRG